jgi:hypothetical protein
VCVDLATAFELPIRHVFECGNSLKPVNKAPSVGGKGGGGCPYGFSRPQEDTKVLEQFLPGVGNIAELLAQTTVGARPRR